MASGAFKTTVGIARQALGAVPQFSGRNLTASHGMATTITQPLRGCPFAGRFALATDRCRNDIPELRAVERVSFQLEARQTLGVVGESGSGKSTLGWVALNRLPADEGSVRFEGRDLAKVPPSNCGPCGGTCRSSFRTRSPPSTT